MIPSGMENKIEKQLWNFLFFCEFFLQNNILSFVVEKLNREYNVVNKSLLNNFSTPFSFVMIIEQGG